MAALGEHLARFYPGLTPKEERVWRHWLVEHEQSFDRFEYNVHVGEGVTPPPGAWTGDQKLDARLREQFRRATQRKLDAVGYRRGEAWVIEVEDRADARALGQLHLYADLAPRTLTGIERIELAVVCRFVGNDMRAAFEAAGFVVWETRQDTNG